MKYHYVEIAYFEAGEGRVCGIHVAPSTVGEVLKMCRISHMGCCIGINGELVTLDKVIRDADRIELYPSLKVDPKTKRHRLVMGRRAKK